MANNNTVPAWLDSATQERQEIYVQVKSFIEAKEYAKAREQIDRLIELLGGEQECRDKANSEIFYLRGEIKTGLEESSYMDFFTAYELSNPKNIEYVKRSALECKKLYNFPWNITLTSAKTWVNADPNDIQAKIVLLEGIDAKRDYEDNTELRRSVLEQALASHPDDPDINYHQARFLFSTSYSTTNREAVPYLLKAVDGRPDNKTWRQELINVLQSLKEERKHLLKYLLLEAQDDPKNLSVLEQIAKWYETFQQWSDAIEARKKLIELEPSSAQSRQKLEIEPLQKLIQLSNAGSETPETRKKKVKKMILIGTHMHGPAMDLINGLVKENPADEALKVVRADVMFLDYDNTDATQQIVDELVAIHAKGSTYWRTYFAMGCYYQRDYSTSHDSLEQYRKANELKPHNYRILKRKISMERGYGDERVLKDYDDFFQITPEYSDLPSYIRYTLESKHWRRAAEGIELAKKVGIEEDFSSDLEYAKKHQQLDEDIAKSPSVSAFEVIPSKIQLVTSTGDAWLNEHKLSFAREDYNKALELAPDNINLIVKVAKVRIAEYDYSEARNILSKAISQEPNNAEAYYQRSFCEGETALADAEKACELKPDTLDYWKQLKYHYRQTERYEDAARVTKKMIELTPAEDQQPLKVELAEYYQDMNRWSEAASLFREVGNEEFATNSEAIAELLKKLPAPTSENMKQIGEAYEKIVEYMTNMYQSQNAIKMVKKLIETEPLSRCAGLYGILANRAKNDYDDYNAKEYYKQAARLDPEDIRWTAGEIETDSSIAYSNDPVQQEEFLDKAFKAAERGAQFGWRVWNNAINIATNLKKLDLALKAHDKYVEVENNEIAWTNRGVFCEDELHNYEQALKSYIRACELSPSNANAWNNRALILNKIGDYTEAFRCAQKSIELDPTFANPYASVAMVYLTQGKLLEAKEYAEKSIQVNSQIPRGYFVLGQIMEQKQQFHDAKKNYETFLQIGHPDPELVKMGEQGKARCEGRIALEEQSGTSKYEDHHYHLFLSHYQRTGGLLAMVLKLLLEQSDPTLKIFLDVDDLENIHDLKANVRNSDTIALLITEGVFERRFVIEEITTALELGKNIILIWDKDRCPWPDPKTVPDHLQKVLLVRAIIWNAEKDFRNVVVHQIESKIARTDQGTQNNNTPHTPQHHGHGHPQAATVSQEQLDQIKTSIQQQYDSFAKLIQQQNELLQQTLAQQNQMFMQLQSNVLQLQQKVESLNSLPASPQGTPASATGPANPTPVSAPAATSTPDSAPVSSEPAVSPAPAQQEQPAETRTSFGSSDEVKLQRSDSQNNNNSPAPASPLVKPRTATASTQPTAVKQTYVVEGWLHKLGGWNKTKWESRYFTCDGTSMVYHDSQQIIQVTSPKGSILLKDIIAVEEVGFDIHKVNCCFAVQTPGKKYFFYADDEISKMKWITALKKK